MATTGNFLIRRINDPNFPDPCEIGTITSPDGGVLIKPYADYVYASFTKIEPRKAGSDWDLIVQTDSDPWGSTTIKLRDDVSYFRFKAKRRNDRESCWHCISITFAGWSKEGLTAKLKYVSVPTDLPNAIGEIEDSPQHSHGSCTVS